MTKHTPLKSLFSMALILAFTSCDDDEPKLTELTSTQFIQNQLTFSENTSVSEISVTLNQPAQQEGIVTISVTTESLNSFTTSPKIADGKIELPVLEGQREVTFTVTPIDNNLLNADQTINFLISSVSEGFTVGSNNALTVKIFDDESPSLVSFQSELSSTLENSGTTTTVTLGLSHASSGTGSIEVSLNSDNAAYGINYVTEPAAIDGKIILQVEPGVARVEFNVTPINDQLFNGERKILYTISHTTGAVMPGLVVTKTLKITDDELLGKGKGYTIGGGSWGYKREYQYNALGQVSKIIFQQSSPGYQLNGYYNYEYDITGNVVKKIDFDLTETTYTWENGEIVKEESYRDGVLKKYVLYGYDQAGNVGEAAYYYRQPDGELKLSLLIVFLYHQDGNIYKQLNYAPIEGSEDYNLLSTKTFERYSTKANPFTMVEVLPNKITQPNLPLSYQLEEGGHNILFQFTYQFDATGKPTKRTATSSTGTETVFYEYY